MDEIIIRIDKEEKEYIVALLLERHSFLDYKLNSIKIRHSGWRRRYEREMALLHTIIHDFTIDEYKIPYVKE